MPTLRLGGPPADRSRARGPRWLVPLLCAAGTLGLGLLGPTLPRAGSGVASAQPAMPDPAQMSGIPRPDPAVPGATVTVRLIRGELSNRVVGVDAQLIDLQKPDAPPLTVKTDAEGRATFPSLTPGNYEARAVLDGEALASQPIAVQPAPAPGVRVMLVFSKSLAEQQKELGTPDGKARIDQGLPAGSLVIKAVDEAAQPVAGLKVTLLRAERASQKVEALPPQNTAADGTVRFDNLVSSTAMGYLAAVQRDGVDHRGQPFRLFAEHGSQIAITARSVSHDKTALQELSIGSESHIVVELQDDLVRVGENLRLVNPRQQAIDPGPDGLRIPLAESALSAQVVPGSPANITVDSSKDGPPVVVWKGPLAPGNNDIQVAFILNHHGQVAFHQPVAQPWDGVRVIVEKLPGMAVGNLTNPMERPFQGKNLIFGVLPAQTIGSVIEFTITGLPAELLILRYAAAVLALGIALCFAYVALYGKPETDHAASSRRQKVEHRRDALLAELVSAEQHDGDPAASAATNKKAGKARPRDKVLAELEQVYRHLDELDGN